MYLCMVLSTSFVHSWTQRPYRPNRIYTSQCIVHRSASRGTPTMLRVQRKRRPEDWERKMAGLSGRFLPMDPRDEKVLDMLETDHTRAWSLDNETYGPEGPPSDAYRDSAVPGRPKKWSKRSEAARKRWADPSYRAKMLEKRAEKRRRDAEAAGEQPKQHKVEIGRMDSITLCDDDKAKAINDYARSNKLRAEKMSAFHRDRKLWMETRLSKGNARMSDEQYIARKKELQKKRKEVARRRAREMRADAQGEANDQAVEDEEEQSRYLRDSHATDTE